MNAHSWGWPALILGATALLIGPGCAGSGSPAPGPEGTVKGRVLVGGKPLAGGKIFFQPSGADFKPQEAVIGKDGTYSVTTPSGVNGARLEVPKGFRSSVVTSYIHSCAVTAGRETEFNFELPARGPGKLNPNG
jgi:hypothetical protein